MTSWGRIVGRAVGAALLFAVGAVGFTWPLFRHPATTVLDARALYGPAQALIQRDVNLTIWVLAWDAHALATQPARLFHANAFFPAPYTLALSEHMLGNVPLFAPVYWATGNPVLAHQATLLASFVLCGLAMAAWVARLTGDGVAALVAGALYVIAPYRIWQLGSLHVVSVQWLPLVFLGIERVLARERLGATLLGAGLVLSALCGSSAGYAGFLGAGVYAAIRLGGDGAAWRARAPRLLGAAAAAAIVLVPVSLPYLRLARSGALPDWSASGFQSLALVWVRELGPLGVLKELVLPARLGVPMFLGWATMAAALVGALVWSRPPRGALVGMLALGVVLACGPVLDLPGGGTASLPYAWLSAVVPGFHAMRVPQRFSVLATLAVVGLAGLAVARLRAVCAGRRTARAAATALAALLVAAAARDSWPGRLDALPMRVGDDAPPEYRWLATHGDGGPVLELPVSRAYGESVAMYYSTVHWLPIANGYSSYPPAAYLALRDTAESLPDPAAMARIVELAPVRWLILRRGMIDAATLATWESTLAGAGFRLVVDFGGPRIYERAPGG